MARELIRGNKGLAEVLRVHPNTVQGWRNRGLLAPATVVEYGRVIVYDLTKVWECLRHHPVKRGRPKGRL